MARVAALRAARAAGTAAAHLEAVEALVVQEEETGVGDSQAAAGAAAVTETPVELAQAAEAKARPAFHSRCNPYPKHKQCTLHQLPRRHTRRRRSPARRRVPLSACLWPMPSSCRCT